MELKDSFPIWDQLTKNEQDALTNAAKIRSVPAGTLLRNGDSDCIGLLVIRTGLLRAFILSDEGKEITLYRLFEQEICLFSASCMMQEVHFDISIEAEKDSEFWVIPTDLYRKIMEQSTIMANYTNQIMASRFSEVMWLIEQILWKSFDKRLASFLIEENKLYENRTIKITHDKIAGHLGTAREVVTRMLRYFQSEGLVSLNRGMIQIIDLEKLALLSEE